MEFLIDFILHIDQHMVEMVRDYHAWTYAILFVIIFCETGLVVTPFLPGDSLLFVAGAIAAQPNMPITVHLLALIVFAAAVLMASFGTICGILCGSMANPMALSYANDTLKGDSAAVSYTSVYPLGMFVRVVIAQIIIMFSV